MPPRRTVWLIGAVDLFTAALVVFGVFGGLPARWWPVDTAAAALAAIEVASAVALFARLPWAARIAQVAGAVALALGLLAVSLLAVTASWLSGVYGPVGRGGAIVLLLIAVLLVPYLIALPIVQLLWLRPPAAGASVAPAAARSKADGASAAPAAARSKADDGPVDPEQA
jgi:hypothetical protein